MPFVTSSIYKKAVDLAYREGLSPSLITHHDERKEIVEKWKYIPIELLLEVYELATEYLNGGFGVRQGMQLNSDDYGTVGLSWKTCWRAKDVLDRVERYMILVTDHGRVKVEEQNGLTTLYLLRDVERKGIGIANEAAFVMLVGILKEVTGKEIYPINVLFKHTNEEITSFTDYFKCPVSFGQHVNALHFKTMDINIPTIKADKSIQQFLIDRMEEEEKGIHSNADRLLGEIHQLIEEALPSGIPSIIQVADYLGTSARTLKRRLAEKGVTFRELVQKNQQKISIDLLKNTSQSIGEIAFHTGFSEQSSFNRAFKRWMGQSPVDYRKNA